MIVYTFVWDSQSYEKCLQVINFKSCIKIITISAFHSGESVRLTPLKPGFSSRTWRHMWIELVVGRSLVFRLFSEGFFGFPCFPPSIKPARQITTPHYVGKGISFFSTQSNITKLSTWPPGNDRKRERNTSLYELASLSRTETGLMFVSFLIRLTLMIVLERGTRIQKRLKVKILGCFMFHVQITLDNICVMRYSPKY